MEDLTISTNEGLTLLAAQARASIGVFFKTHERLTEEPRATDEIIEEMMGQDEKGNPVRLYRVRCIVIDIDRLTDPRFGPLVRKFKDSPREGLSLEIHDSQGAIVKLLEAQGVFKPSATASLNIDMTKLADAQLERIANGEDPLKVLMSGSNSSIAPGAGAGSHGAAPAADGQAPGAEPAGTVS